RLRPARHRRGFGEERPNPAPRPRAAPSSFGREGVMKRLVALVPLLLVLPACEDLPAAPEVPNTPPTASFFYTPVSPIYTGHTVVSFDAQGSHDMDGKIMSYEWNFGDGSPVQT